MDAFTPAELDTSERFLSAMTTAAATRRNAAATPDPWSSAVGLRNHDVEYVTHPRRTGRRMVLPDPTILGVSLAPGLAGEAPAPRGRRAR